MGKIDIEPITSLKRAAEVAERVNEHRRPMYITQNGRPVMVIQDVESFEEREHALALLKLCLDGQRAIDEGRSKPLAEFRRSSRRRIRAIIQGRDLE